ETLSLWFTLIVLSALRRSDNENQLSNVEFDESNAIVDPHGFEGYLKMVVKVPDSN
ncbi:hypothetical protein Tco_0254741, partial [Tanacetum coccineum]